MKKTRFSVRTAFRLIGLGTLATVFLLCGIVFYMTRNVTAIVVCMGIYFDPCFAELSGLFYGRYIYRLLLPTLFAGLLAGYGCGGLAAPKIVGLMDGLKSFYEPAPVLLPSCVAAVFVVITVKVSRITPLEAIPKALCQELEELTFAEHMEIVYAEHSQPDHYEEAGDGYYLRARVESTGILAKDFKRAQEEQLTYPFDTTDGDLRVPMCGVSAKTVQRTLESGDFEIVDGVIEPEKLGTGNYVIYQPFGRSAEHPAVHAGDAMDIGVQDEKTGNIEQSGWRLWRLS